MNIIQRIKNIITSPNKEWDVINSETGTVSSVLTSYVLVLGIAGAIAHFIGYSFIGMNLPYTDEKINGLSWGLNMGITYLAGVIIGYFISAYVIDMLAPNFGSEKNINKSAQLVGYAYTPSMVGALLAIIPSLQMIGSLFGLYGLYLLYLGIPKLKKTPNDKLISYFIVSLLVIIVVYLVIGYLISLITDPIFGNPARDVARDILD